MRIRRRVIHELLLTPSEADSFVNLLDEARRGTTVHSASTRMVDGATMQVTIDNDADMPPRVRDEIERDKEKARKF